MFAFGFVAPIWLCFDLPDLGNPKSDTLSSERIEKPNDPGAPGPVNPIKLYAGYGGLHARDGKPQHKTALHLHRLESMT